MTKDTDIPAPVINGQQSHGSVAENQPKTAADEIDQINFTALSRPFAAGIIRLVSASLDFEQVVQALIDNQAELVAEWINNGDISVPDDQEVQDWMQRDLIVTAAVVAPYVVVKRPAAE